jgi:hypothetical protein
MKKIILLLISIVVIIALAGIYKFNYLSSQPGYDVDGNKIKTSIPTGLHPSWDVNKDGLNDCEDDGSCDHTVDYSQPR